MTFEEKLERLKEIVDTLESPDTLDLDSSLKLFEEGITLVRTSRKLLDEAELKIKTVSQEEIEDSDTETISEDESGEW